MRATTVRIIKCDEPLAWYANKIGETFEVIADSEDGHDYYILEETFFDLGGDGWRIIYPEDCVVCEQDKGVKE